VVTAADVDAQLLDWLWPMRLARGKVALCDGDPGLGKSTVWSADVAARVSTGDNWPDGSPGCEPADVLLISAEDGLEDTIRPRLEAAGADLHAVHVLTEIDCRNGTTRPVSIPGDLPMIEREIATRNVALVVIDPLMAFLGADIDSHRDQDVRRAMHMLKGLAERTGACIVVVRHLTKDTGKKAVYRGGGSIGIIGAARTAFLIAKDPEDENRRILACTKSNVSREPPALAYFLEEDPALQVGRVRWDGAAEFTADELVHAGSEQASKKFDTIEFLQAQVEDGPRLVNDVKEAAKAAGISWTTIERCKEAAGVESRRRAFGGPWWLYPVTASAPDIGRQSDSIDRHDGLCADGSVEPDSSIDRQQPDAGGLRGEDDGLRESMLQLVRDLTPKMKNDWLGLRESLGPLTPEQEEAAYEAYLAAGGSPFDEPEPVMEEEACITTSGSLGY
jgi:hypothetical protein